MSDELQVPRISTPAALAAWVDSTSRIDEPSTLVAWARAAAQLGYPTPTAAPPLVANLVARRAGVDPDVPLDPATTERVAHPSWDLPTPAPGPRGDRGTGMPSWWQAGHRIDFTALVMRGELTAAALREQSRAARASGMHKLARSMDSQAQQWAATAAAALPYAAAWELAPLRRWWEATSTPTTPTPNPPIRRNNSWH